MKAKIKNEHRLAYRQGRHSDIPEAVLRLLADEIVDSVMAEPEPEPKPENAPLVAVAKRLFGSENG